MSLVYYRDSGFDGEYRDNILEITGDKYYKEDDNQWYYPCTTFGFIQRKKGSHEITHKTFNINKPSFNRGYNAACKFEEFNDDTTTIK